MRNNYVDRLDKLAHLLSQDKHAFFYDQKNKAEALETVNASAALIRSLIGEAGGIVDAIRPPPRCKANLCDSDEMIPMPGSTHSFYCETCADVAWRDDEGGITYASEKL